MLWIKTPADVAAVAGDLVEMLGGGSSRLSSRWGMPFQSTCHSV